MKTKIDPSYVGLTKKFLDTICIRILDKEKIFYLNQQIRNQNKFLNVECRDEIKFEITSEKKKFQFLLAISKLEFNIEKKIRTLDMSSFNFQIYSKLTNLTYQGRNQKHNSVDNKLSNSKFVNIQNISESPNKSKIRSHKSPTKINNLKNSSLEFKNLSDLKRELNNENELESKELIDKFIFSASYYFEQYLRKNILLTRLRELLKNEMDRISYILINNKNLREKMFNKIALIDKNKLDILNDLFKSIYIDNTYCEIRKSRIMKNKSSKVGMESNSKIKK